MKEQGWSHSQGQGQKVAAAQKTENKGKYHRKPFLRSSNWGESFRGVPFSFDFLARLVSLYLKDGFCPYKLSAEG